MKYTVAILVSQKYEEEPFRDDVLLKETLERKNIIAKIIAWDNPHLMDEKVDVAIIRSCWDYDQRVEEFLEKMRQLSKKSSLLNSYEIVKENSNKIYLNTLEKRGISIVPTIFTRQIKITEIPFSSEYVIVKPTVSASGKDTNKVLAKDINEINRFCQEMPAGKMAMIQPYISSVEHIGEKSTVVIGGKPVYTMKKTPKKGGYLVHIHKGGTYTPTEMTDGDILFINRVIDCLEEIPLYCRIDYLYGEKGEPMLLELEMIEPNLYLSQNEEGLNLLVQGIEQKLENNRSFVL